MSITITLDPETQRSIERKAARLHITADEYLVRLAVRSARSKPAQAAKQSSVSSNAEQEDRFQAIIDRADPGELKAIGLELPKYPARNGAELIANLRAAGLLNGFGDPSIDSPELARMLREQARLGIGISDCG